MDRPRESAFACQSGGFRLGARPFDRAAARVESALHWHDRRSSGGFAPSSAIFRSRPVRPGRMLSAAFGPASGSANKTGGNNRLAGKNVN